MASKPKRDYPGILMAAIAAEEAKQPSPSKGKAVSVFKSVTVKQNREFPGILLKSIAALPEEPVKSKQTKHRSETSLGQLTRKFIGLLQNASDGVSAWVLLFGE